MSTWPTSSPTRPFWVAVLRIATPLILGTLGVLLCERAGVLNLGIEGIMVAGAFTGWLSGLPGRAAVGRRGRGALTGIVFGLLHATLTVLLRSRSTWPAWASRCWPRRWSYYGYRVSFPKVDTPPTITPFAGMDWLGLPVLAQQSAADAAGAAAGAGHRLVLYRTPLPGWRCAWSARTRRRPRPGGIRWPVRTAGDRGRLGADGRGRRLPDAVGLQRLLLQHGQRARLDLRGAGGVRVLAAGQGPAGALLFAFFDALQLRLQQAGDAALPHQVYLMLPYLLSIAALVLVGAQGQLSAGLMKPHLKGEALRLRARASHLEFPQSVPFTTRSCAAHVHGPQHPSMHPPWRSMSARPRWSTTPTSPRCMRCRTSTWPSAPASSSR